ncbi:MAG: alpha/beta hydrolase [Cyclobacteriaceae bacterium]
MRKIKLALRTSVVSMFVIWSLSIPGYGNSNQKSSDMEVPDLKYNQAEMKNNIATDTIKAYASVNGIKLYYEISGTGEPLIVLHGGFGNTEFYIPNLTELGKHYKVITVDLQGHGRTADIDRPLSREAMADDIAALIKHLNLEKTNVIGYSFGGWVALRLAIQHPELLNKVVLISCPFKRTGWFPELRAQQDQLGAETAEGLKETPMYHSYAKKAPKPQDWTKLVTKMSATLQKDFDWSKEVGAVKLPVLLMFGDADEVMPVHMLEFFKLLGGGMKGGDWDGSGRPISQLAIIPNQTHYDIFMSPALSDIIMPFLKKE